jgi:hypothetical protein
MRTAFWMIVAGCTCRSPEPVRGGPEAPDPSQAPEPPTSEPPCGALATFEGGRAPTRTLHVSPEGDDDGDGSTGAPFLTIERAAREATPGTEIVLAPGSHVPDQYLQDLAGTAEAPIWIGGSPGQALPVLEGGGEGLHLVRPRYVILHDLEVTGNSANGLNADDGGDYADSSATHHVIFRDLHIHDVGTGGNQDCLKLSGLSDFFVLDSTFERCSAGGSAVDHVGCHAGLLARNVFTDNGSNSVQAKGGSSDIEIRWNRFTRGGERVLNLGGSTGFEFFRPPLETGAPNAEARDLRAIANLIEGGDASIAFVGCVDCVVAHNTVLDPGHWTFRILQETVSSGGYTFEPAQGGLIVNNLVQFQRAVVGVDVNVGADTLPETFTWTTNLFYAEDDPASSAPELPGTETGTIVGEDPLLDAEGAPGPGSPARGAGTAGADTSGDLAGRCWADPPTVGAFEP